MIFLLSLVSFSICFVGFPVLISRFKRARIVGKNMNNNVHEKIPEMGGIMIIIGFLTGIIFVLALRKFFGLFISINIEVILSSYATILSVAIIGMIDDLISIRQAIKAFIPMLAALPLMVTDLGHTTIYFPLFSKIDFGIYYSLILIPVGITVAANAVNMLAGFNGSEIGMGLIAMISLSIIALIKGEITSLVILIIISGAFIATLYYNWYPAQVLIGDTGTLSIGAIIAVGAIIGNFELAGVILIIPYVIDFTFKARNRFPAKNWWGSYRDGKIYCPRKKPISFCQWIMKLNGGISERNLVLVLMGIEAVFGAVAILLYI